MSNSNRGVEEVTYSRNERPAFIKHEEGMSLYTMWSIRYSGKLYDVIMLSQDIRPYGPHTMGWLPECHMYAEKYSKSLELILNYSEVMTNSKVGEDLDEGLLEAKYWKEWKSLLNIQVNDSDFRNRSQLMEKYPEESDRIRYFEEVRDRFIQSLSSPNRNDEYHWFNFMVYAANPNFRIQLGEWSLVFNRKRNLDDTYETVTYLD